MQQKHQVGRQFLFHHLATVLVCEVTWFARDWDVKPDLLTPSFVVPRSSSPPVSSGRHLEGDIALGPCLTLIISLGESFLDLWLQVCSFVNCIGPGVLWVYIMRIDVTILD